MVNSPLRVATKTRSPVDAMVIRLLVMGSAAGERLEHRDLVARADAVGERDPVLGRIPVHIDRDMAAQPALVVENVSPEARPVHAGLRQRLAQARSLDLDLGGRHMALQMGGEADAGHQVPPWPVATAIVSAPRPLLRGAAIASHLRMRTRGGE